MTQNGDGADGNAKTKKCGTNGEAHGEHRSKSENKNNNGSKNAEGFTFWHCELGKNFPTVFNLHTSHLVHSGVTHFLNFVGEGNSFGLASVTDV